jgi:hypothetical protein
MTLPAFHLAQVNVGRLLHPQDAPEAADFMNNLDRINALADSTPERLTHLRAHGATPYAFSFKQPFPPVPEAGPVPPVLDECA